MNGFIKPFLKKAIRCFQRGKPCITRKNVIVIMNMFSTQAKKGLKIHHGYKSIFEFHKVFSMETCFSDILDISNAILVLSLKNDRDVPCQWCTKVLIINPNAIWHLRIYSLQDF
jgi:hypothetical protein